MPGYLTMPIDTETTFDQYMSTRQYKPLRPDQISYYQNYKAFFVSFMKSMYGSSATAQNDWAYDWLPKLDVPSYDVIRIFDMMAAGKVNGYFCQGFNPLLAFPNRAKCAEALSKLKFLVIMDPLKTETAHFWENHGVYNDVKTAEIQTEVVQLPTTCFAEDDGSLTNSGRWLQWHWAAATPPGIAKRDNWIMGQIFTRLRALYRQEGGAFPDPILNLVWNYRDAGDPTADEIAMEVNGSALENVVDMADPLKVLVEKGKQLPGFSVLRDDGTTASGCWIYSGCYTEAGNQMARRDNTDVGNASLFPNWTWAWPANRRILYNRASADVKGNSWDDTRKLLWWDGSKWTGNDVPDITPTAKPGMVGPFIMNAEGTGRLFARQGLREGPFPVHYEPFEAPIANLVAPKIRGNPAARVFADDLAQMGDVSEFPYVATSYRLTEHFHYWTKHTHINAALQPQFFIEIGEDLAHEKRIENGGWVRVWSKRGSIEAKVVVTKRIGTLICDGKKQHVVGIPLHWGFIGQTKKGFGPNSLTPVVGDANIQTPEFKAFLVNIESITVPSV
jgi:formate dehydrogenase major subunit